MLSDVHYAGRTERTRGNDYEYRDISNFALRHACRLYRHWIWLRAPLQQTGLLERFLEQVGHCDLVFAVGDYTSDTGFVGVSDDAACESASECLVSLRRRFGPRLHAIIGDHDLGKFSMFGRRGGMRLASWERATGELGLQPFWRLEMGRYVCLGITSSLVAFPTFESEALPSERSAWLKLRVAHLAEIRDAFSSLRADQRVLLFCHDPTALPFLWSESAIRDRVGQIEQTVVGHLHSELILWKSRLLAGMPTIPFLGHTARRLSTALGRARDWRPFRVRLCPSLAGIELLKDGGFYTAELEEEAQTPIRFQRHRLPR